MFSFYCVKVVIVVIIVLMMVFLNGLNFLVSIKINYVKLVDFSVLNLININFNSFF